jgi:hypothetical protein
MEAPQHERNADQAAYWGGAAGQRWLERQEMLDSALAAPRSSRSRRVRRSHLVPRYGSRPHAMRDAGAARCAGRCCSTVSKSSYSPV